MKPVGSFLPFGLACALLLSGLAGCNAMKGGKSATSEDSSQRTSEPNVTFQSLDGNTVALDTFKGKVVLVNFWATWCEPCIIEIPWLIDFQKKYASRGFTILGVAMDDDGKPVVQPFVEKHEFNITGGSSTMNYPIVLGNDDIAQKFGGIIGLPTSWVITRDGKIAKKVIGMANREDLDGEIQRLLDEPVHTAQALPLAAAKDSQAQ